MSKSRDRLIDSFAEWLIDKAEFASRIKVMTLRLAEIDSQQKVIDQATENRRELLLLVNRVEEFSAAVKDRLNTDNFMMKRDILRALVKRVKIYRDEIVVVFRVNPGNDPIQFTGSDTASGESMPDCLRRAVAVAVKPAAG